MELISREEAKRKIIEELDSIDHVPSWVFRRLERVISSLPTIEEQREGTWIFKTVFPNDKSEFPIGYLVCSVCGSHYSNSTPCNYCPNCGAYMKGE